MKNKLLLFSISAFLSHQFCNTQNKNSMNSKTYSNIETVRKMYEAMSRKDITTWISFWADNGIQYLPYSPEGFPKSVAGKSTLEKIYRQLLDGYGELRYTHIDIESMSDPDKVLVRWGVDIELKGKSERYQNELIGIFEFENGKVKNFTEYFNPIQFMKAIQ